MPAEAFEVDPITHWLGGLVSHHPRFWQRLGDLETRLAADAIAPIGINAPIYVAGLARAGSTILLEKLAAHPDARSHRYRDYPGIFTPIAWNYYLDRVPGKRAGPVERSHGDGLMVTEDSPEAVEEMLWMAFFDGLHDVKRSAVLTRAVHNSRFERFYPQHIRKLLALRGGKRYLAKGNYNVARFEYLLRLFPDARFVVPVRSPATHIGSLMKQQRLFTRKQRRYPRALAYMRRIGHFEFGLDRRPINFGDHRQVRAIEQAWADGAEVLGWARYWQAVHSHIAKRLEASAALREATMIVSFDTLCQQPHTTLSRIYEHCGLALNAVDIDQQTASIHYPDYYKAELSAQELETIDRETAAIAAHYGHRAVAEA